MRIRFDEDVLNRPQEYGPQIESIIERCYSEQHHWIINDLDAVMGSAWMQGRAKWSTHDEFAEKIYRQNIDRPSGSTQTARLLVVTADVRGAANDLLGERRETPQVARRILEKPLFLCVENSHSDGAFVKAISELHAADVWTAIENQWLKLEHAGGKGELIKKVDELLSDGVVPWRIAVLMDSDRLDSGPLPTDNLRIEEELTKRKIQVFPLFKREAENYLPPSLLGKGLLVSVFLALSPKQRDYFDMKKGFRQQEDGTVVIPEEQLELYANLSKWQLQQLVGGFGKSIGDRFQSARLMLEEMNFVCQTKPGELEMVFASLQEML